ncbi:MAG: RagB/SusD family nutrient uptake outer membrane protein [Alistipes sp.]|jgi:hypothetical protein|nr:RagB/SusD family nutrient uptake outer membrane protein [Alistipes sp.]
MNKIKHILACGLITMAASSCSDFLELDPKGSLSSDQLTSPEYVEKMVIAAYSLIENDNVEMMPWLFSDLRSGDAYKGGGGPSDMGFAHNIEVANTLLVNTGQLNTKWTRGYIAISRANNALSRINALEESDYPEKNIRSGEMRFLRAHHMFELKVIFKYPVWVDETISDDELKETSNRKYTDAELWGKIIEDFRFAVANLPEDNKDVGRADKWAAKAYLAKALLYAAYEQDEQNNVVNIDKTKLEEVVSLVDELGAKFSLVNDFADNFRWETENGPESIFAIQNSHDDGVPFGRLNMTSVLSYPMSAGYGCCGMHIPTQELVNAFKTDSATGLPMFGTFNTPGEDIEDATDLASYTVDPRLLHTVAMIGLPYKYADVSTKPAADKEKHIVNITFPREGGIYYGPFLSMKEVVSFDCPCFEQARWYYSSSLNRDIIRYDDALLWKVEALVEIGGADNLNAAREIINSLRERAGRSTGMLRDAEGNLLADAGQFKVGLYDSFADQDEARNAFRWERRLEMAMEASRGFDLVRWGIAAETLNDYYATEAPRREHLKTARFTKNKDEYFPIPYRQISFSRGVYEQNYGW